MSVLVRNSAGGGGYDFTARINVTYPPEAVVTCSLGDRTYTDSSHTGSHKFRIHKAGTWSVKAVSGSKESTREVIIETNGQVVNIELSFSQVFGITRDITKSSPAWARTDKAVGMTATASVGTVAGHSDFDNFLPWSGMKRETLSTGDVMVKIPKFWYQRYRTGNIETIKIANVPAEGFAVHPAFRHADVESDYIYVGAYKTSNSKFSKSGSFPHINATRSSMRNSAKSKGAGWGLIDVSTWSAIEMLMMVEFATNDVQSAIGMGFTNSNSYAISTGSCDSVPNLTGVPAGSVGRVDVVYRGIEGLWGNVYEWVDGINYSGGKKQYYICNDPMKYEDNTANNYMPLSYRAPSDGFISKVGLDAENNHLMYPTETSGSDSTYYCDKAYFGSSNWYVLLAGGDWGGGFFAGVFSAYFDHLYSHTASYIGSRLLYIPS